MELFHGKFARPLNQNQPREYRYSVSMLIERHKSVALSAR